MPKKQKVQPFWAFVMEFKRENRIESIEEAKAKADVIWRTMTPLEKKSYGGTAKKEAPLTPLEIKYNEEQLFKQTMKEQITTELTIARKYNCLETHNFYLIHINSFCFNSQDLKHYPCEIGISCFSLANGVTDKFIYHSMVYPGPLPSGYSGEARIISQSTHQISWEVETDNQEAVFEEVMMFLKITATEPSSTKLPILYATREKELEIVKTVMDSWCDVFSPSMRFTIYHADLLFSLLIKHTMKNLNGSPESLSFYEFNRDVYSLSPNLSCEYHKLADCPIYCSKSIATRFVYIICEKCCPDLGIDLIPGYHVPSNATHNGDDGKSSSKSNDDAGSTIRDDSSEVETLASYTKSSSFVDDSASSIGFPEYDDCVESSKNIIRKGNNAPLSGGLSNEMKTGSSGFSRKPAALPSTVNSSLSNLTLSQDAASRGDRGWTVARGRGAAVPKGKGRGVPFRK